MSSNPQRLGTAFDYLFRFQLQRRNGRVQQRPWIAESVARSPAIPASEVGESLDFDDLFKRMERRSTSNRVLRKAKKDLAGYCRKRKRSENDCVCLASHALRLAAMDEVYRGRALPPDFEHVDALAVNELVDLLRIVPFEKFVCRARTILNPDFGKASRIVGGADADLIVGDQLIDLKTTKDQSVEVDEIDQLVGYFILARQSRLTNRRFPRVNRLALYYSRHAYLWTWDVAKLHEDKSFLEMEAWFVRQANELVRL